MRATAFLVTATIGVCNTIPCRAADVVYLSDYLGVPSGTAATAENPPFTTIPFIALPHGFGADCPGNWTNIKIHFRDSGTFEKGIGQHPGEWDARRIDFHLGPIGAAAGRPLLSFRARVGVEDQTSTNNNGGVFEVLVDNVLKSSTPVNGRLAPSVPIAVDLAGAGTLSLVTTRTGDFNSNHMCWADASISLGTPCLGDLNRDGLVDDADFVFFIAAYDILECADPSMPADCPSDFNHDALVDDADFSLFVLAYDALLCP